jgi:zinc protease
MNASLAALVLVAITAPVCAAQHASPDSLTISYDVNGLRVIQRPAYGSQLVSVNLYLLGGTQQLTQATAGIERLALDAAPSGTRRYPGAASKTAFSRTGSEWRVRAGADWSTVGFLTTVTQFDSTWAVFADRIAHPTLDSASVATARARLRLEADRRRQDPRMLLRAIADSVIFAGHPYALDPDGTAESMDRITVTDVQRYVATQFVTSRMLLVIVGTVPRERVEAAVAATLGTLPRGTYHWTVPPPLPGHPHPTITVIDRPLSTTYLLGYFYGPPVTSSDYAAFHVAVDLLSGGVRRSAAFQTARPTVEPMITYAAGATFFSRAIALGGVDATTGAPSSILYTMRARMHQTQEQRYPLWVIQDYLNDFTTAYRLSRQTNMQQADALARAQIYWGDYRQADAEFEAFRHVTPAEVRTAARYYMRNMQFVYLGDPADLDQSQLEGF